jgi:hypothetical protein
MPTLRGHSGARRRREPGIQFRRKSLLGWIPGSLASRAPRNDQDFLGALGAALLGLVALTGAGAAQPAPQCTGNQKPWMVAELLFGRGDVSDFNWTRFVDAEITPRFPDGLTAYDARGQWKNPQTGTISRERSKMVMIAMPPDPDNDAKLQEIIAAYKTRFKQQSVGLIIKPACVSF